MAKNLLTQRVIDLDNAMNKRTKRSIDSAYNASYSDDDSFVAHERSIVNSCKKNKENLFDKDKLTKSDTPRRETYTVETSSENLQTVNCSMVKASATPTLKKADKDEFLNVTLSRGSEKRGRKSKRKVSFVTPLRRSARISAATPVYNSVKDRPKTPMPSRLSSVEALPKQEPDAIACNLNLDISLNMDPEILTGNKKRPSTPMPLSKQNKRRLSSLGDSKNRAIPLNLESTPKVVQPLKELKEEELCEESPVLSKIPEDSKKVRVKQSITPKRGKTPNDVNGAKVKQSITPKAAVSKSSKKDTPLPSKSSQKASKLTPSLKGCQKNIDTSSPIHLSKKTAVLTPGIKKTAILLPSKRVGTPTPGCKRTATPSLSLKRIGTPTSRCKRIATSSLSSKKIGTPNFNKIHQKAINKMESIDDYSKRKAQNSMKKLQEQRKFHTPAKSNVSKKVVAEKKKKAPKTFSGIPFVPAAPTTRIMRNQFSSSAGTAKTAISNKSKSLNERVLAKKMATAGNLKMIKMSMKQNENTPLKQKPKFDLRASLARKLPYKPHSGPLKPLADANMNMSLNSTALRSGKTTENQVIKANRIESRKVLKGVRKNKRFLLQMNNRQMDTSQL